ncbi:MAG: VacJ family lipoprotein [Gemmobacter sp.]|jgi:phospholipid-binding lipoprotein MlaA|nr:VacJ family lipoprotein [Gemmobacter sp.]
MKMTFPLSFQALRKSGRKAAAVAMAAVLLAACAPPPPQPGLNDPFEQTNRAFHGFNRGLDRALVRPSSKIYGAVLPQPVQTGIANFASNLSLPGDAANGALQGNPERFVTNVLRFALNTTVGIGGLFDPAGALGIHRDKTDFGETLHVWGAGEGAYLEFPGLGPSTVRDAVGTAVDIAANPVGMVLASPEKYYATAAKVGSKLGDRNRYSSTIDSVLYDSADSYAQTRLLYLQNRRFELGQTDAGTGDDFIDPYAD